MEKRKLTQIHLNPQNPRLIKDEAFKRLVESIKSFPKMLEIKPIVIDDLGEILAGNQRYRACKELGIKEVPVLLASNLTEEQKQEFIIKDNTHFGEWDFNMLSTFHDSEELEAWGVPVWPSGDIEPIDLTSKEAKEDDFEAPPIEEVKTDIKYGDIIQIGNHRLVCGDSTKIKDVERLMKGKKADLWLTDPPYNVDYTGKTKDALKVSNDSMGDSAFREFLKDAFSNCFEFMNAGASFYIFHADSEGFNFRGAVFDCSQKVRQCLVWVKNSLVMGRQDYHWKHEPCLYGWKEGASHNWYSDRSQTTVLEFDRPSRSTEHPTMKPIPLFAYLIGNSSKTADLVLDTFLGSGSTMVACHQLDRICYGMELEPKYCQVIVDRMKKLDPSIEVRTI